MVEPLVNKVRHLSERGWSGGGGRLSTLISRPLKPARFGLSRRRRRLLRRTIRASVIDAPDGVGASPRPKPRTSGRSADERIDDRRHRPQRSHSDNISCANRSLALNQNVVSFR
jgi:hypothetical protein